MSCCSGVPYKQSRPFLPSLCTTETRRHEAVPQRHEYQIFGVHRIPIPGKCCFPVEGVHIVEDEATERLRTHGLHPCVTRGHAVNEPQNRLSVFPTRQSSSLSRRRKQLKRNSLSADRFRFRTYDVRLEESRMRQTVPKLPLPGEVL